MFSPSCSTNVQDFVLGLINRTEGTVTALPPRSLIPEAVNAGVSPCCLRTSPIDSRVPQGISIFSIRALDSLAIEGWDKPTVKASDVKICFIIAGLVFIFIVLVRQ